MIKLIRSYYCELFDLLCMLNHRYFVFTLHFCVCKCIFVILLEARARQTFRFSITVCVTVSNDANCFSYCFWFCIFVILLGYISSICVCLWLWQTWKICRIYFVPRARAHTHRLPPNPYQFVEYKTIKRKQKIDPTNSCIQRVYSFRLRIVTIFPVWN